MESKEKPNVQKLGDDVLLYRDNPTLLRELLPIVRSSFKPSQYERVLMTRLRDKNCKSKDFRDAANKLGELLVNKTVECLPIKNVNIVTPVASTQGEVFSEHIELLSVMRSGDALLEIFLNHFPQASISKILIQRDEETAEPHFKYMKLSPTIASGNYIIITEPMIATGGTLEMVISLLKQKGIEEQKIIIASICAAPEGLARLSKKFPNINVVLSVLDDGLNDKKYIVPGIGDFGDRYFGTTTESLE